MNNQILMVAAEASSVLYARRLLEHWQKTKTSVRAFGVGDEAMEALGFERFGKSEEMAVVGLAEIIEHYGFLKAIFEKLVSVAKERRPAVVVIMDYPEFNLRLAAEMKKIGIPVVYYIPPQVWAWRKGRVHKMRELCDLVLPLFPFELEFYQKNQVKTLFVGHPLLDEISKDAIDPELQKRARSRYGFSPQDLVVGIMPGSRKSELMMNLPLQFDAMNILFLSGKGKNEEVANFDGNLKVVVLVAPSFSKEQVREAIENYEKEHQLNFSYVLIKDEPFAMISLVDFMLAASGTATLMVGLLRKPMVIMYKVKAVTYYLMRVLAPGVKFVGLPNLILQKEVAPERLQTSAKKLAQAMGPFLKNSDLRLQTAQELAKLEGLLGSRGVTQRVAEVLTSYFREQAPQLEEVRPS
jgi:lipid-A-disaccharide synthase